MDSNFVASELDEYTKQRSRPTDESLTYSPLRTLAIDLFRSETIGEPSVEAAIACGIDSLDNSPEKLALAELLPASSGAWESLGKRGEAAAARLGIGYDSLRRKDDGGRRRIDDLYTRLAESLTELHGASQRGVAGIQTASHVLPEQAAQASLFLSYAHDDDKHEGGFVSDIRDQIVSEFKFQTGADLSVFQDSRGISVGEPWKQRLVDELANTDFLLVFLTPSYLGSGNCRDELDRFFKREEALGRADLVLPIYYADLGPRTDDQLAQRLLERQYTDWRDLRFEEPGSPLVRRRIADLVTSIGSAISRNPTQNEAIDYVGSREIDDGVLERLAAMEVAFPQMTRTLEELVRGQRAMTAVISEGGAQLKRLQQRGQGSAAKLFVSKRLAEQLEPHASNMTAISLGFEDQLAAIGNGIAAIAEELPDSTEAGVERNTQTLIDSLTGLFKNSLEVSSNLDELDRTMKKSARLSTTLQPVLARFSATWRPVKDSPETFSQWVALLEDALGQWRGQNVTVENDT